MRPVFRIVIDDRGDITDLVRDRLLSLRVVDEAGHESDSAELRLEDRDSAIRLPPRGAKMTVSLGYDGREETVAGTYVVDEFDLSGPPDTVAIRAKGADMRAELKAQKTRSWDDVTMGDLVDRIGAEHGLEARVGSALRSIRIPHLDQVEESNLHLLTRLARDRRGVRRSRTGGTRAQAGHLAPARSERSGEPAWVDRRSTRDTLRQPTDERVSGIGDWMRGWDGEARCPLLDSAKLTGPGSSGIVVVRIGRGTRDAGFAAEYNSPRWGRGSSSAPGRTRGTSTTFRVLMRKRLGTQGGVAARGQSAGGGWIAFREHGGEHEDPRRRVRRRGRLRVRRGIGDGGRRAGRGTRRRAGGRGVPGR